MWFARLISAWPFCYQNQLFEQVGIVSKSWKIEKQTSVKGMQSSVAYA
ncbi:hypothetical protein l11_07230 [Neisseria weaveri LMG 5135]|nr:hypothetical protein l11_07230 [Neisseria weaveri LMG 5135]